MARGFQGYMVLKCSEWRGCSARSLDAMTRPCLGPFILILSWEADKLGRGGQGGVD